MRVIFPGFLFFPDFCKPSPLQTAACHCQKLPAIHDFLDRLLGTELIGKLSYYERWVTVFANILFQKQILTPEELAIRMGNVTARHSREAAEQAL